jgi:hypothetical protein
MISLHSLTKVTHESVISKHFSMFLWGKKRHTSLCGTVLLSYLTKSVGFFFLSDSKVY